MEEVAVTSVPAATEPKSAGDIVGRMTPNGMNSPMRSTCLTRPLSSQLPTPAAHSAHTARPTLRDAPTLVLLSSRCCRAGSSRKHLRVSARKKMKLGRSRGGGPRGASRVACSTP